ncbi:LptA/OstA family protein [Candidatus Magnetaquicoccus inordinatus]|uniref:LptA/OstA family protein n=1 Tax=Candidatus Magnetaquicoccus inordinatus TaxID=2496818 RepID=UPI00102C098E|nr:LptA/OstA family protein [Candidatus Magnetaquicoccus inordinatus]
MMRQLPVLKRFTLLRNRAVALALLLSANLCLSAGGWGANTTTTQEGLVITADRMELDDKKQVAVFFGSVRADEKRIQLTADKMTVFYQKNSRRQASAGNRGGVAKIHAEGHVLLVQEESQGTADEMIYLVDKQTLEMVGQVQNAAILHANDRLEGKKILLTIADDHTISKINVQSGEQRRVSARIMPTENGQPGITQPTPSSGKAGKSANSKPAGQ